MRTFTLWMLFLFCFQSSFAQDRIALELGMDKTWSYKPFMPTGPSEYQTSYACPTFGVSYLRRVQKHLYVGGKAYVESYSFRYDQVSRTGSYLFGGTDSTHATQIRFKGTYLFLAPLLDLGLGKHQYFHFYIMPGAGILVNGSQSTRLYKLVGSATISDITQNTASVMNTVVFRFNVGLVQHIRLSNDWHITINESIGAVSDLSDQKGTNGLPLQPNYYTLQVGLMRKYHLRLITPADSREQLH